MSEITLTVQLPIDLHTRLQQYIYPKNASLNQLIVDAIRRDLERAEPILDSEHKQILQTIKESALYEPLSPEWDQYTAAKPELSYAELRQKIGELSPPLSETIIEDRGPH